MIKEKKWNLNEIVDNYKKWDEIGTWLMLCLVGNMEKWEDRK